MTVFENGRQLGTAGAAPMMIAPGRHHLDFVNKSLALKLSHYVDAVAGQVVTVPLGDADPVPPLNLITAPDGAVFHWVAPTDNGIIVVDTPVDVAVESAAHVSRRDWARANVVESSVVRLADDRVH